MVVVVSVCVCVLEQMLQYWKDCQLVEVVCVC